MTHIGPINAAPPYVLVDSMSLQDRGVLTNFLINTLPEWFYVRGMDPSRPPRWVDPSRWLGALDPRTRMPHPLSPRLGDELITSVSALKQSLRTCMCSGMKHHAYAQRVPSAAVLLEDLAILSQHPEVTGSLMGIYVEGLSVPWVDDAGTVRRSSVAVINDDGTFTVRESGGPRVRSSLSQI